jgi:sugar lactone lactonase YvrE
MNVRWSWLVAILCAACGRHPSVPPDAPVPPDAAASDAAPDAPPAPCGQIVTPVEEVTDWPYAMASAPDGTLVYQQQGDAQLWRLAPGSATPVAWGHAPALLGDLAISSNGTVYATAYDHTAYVMDATSNTPVASGIDAYGMTLGPDDTLYVTREEASGYRIARVESDGTLTPVTGDPFVASVGDLAFAPDGTLLVVEMFGELQHDQVPVIFRITLGSDGLEQSRTTIVLQGAATPIYGLAVGGDGRMYIAGGRRVWRWDPAAPDTTTAISGDITIPAKLVFGRGCLRATDLYVAGQPFTRIDTTQP